MGAAGRSDGEVRRVTLGRGRHRWTFECGPGEEGILLDALTRASGRPDSPLDRFDVSIVARELASGRRPRKAPGDDADALRSS